LQSRLRALEMTAAQVSPAVLGNAAATQALLERGAVLHDHFNGGVIALGSDGTAIADVPLSAGRIGINYMDRGNIAAALKEGRSTIGPPTKGKKLPVAVFSMAVPVRDAEGRVIGALAGTTDLSKPSFLDKITQSQFGRTGGYVLVAPQHGLTVTATDKNLVLRPNPAPGINPLFDRYVQGFEGYGSTVDSRGSSVYSAAKRVPSAGWLLVSRISQEEAIAPIRAMQKRILLFTFLFTLLAGALIWWTIASMLRRQFSPMIAATRALAVQSGANQPPQALPIATRDEIGDLIGGFNHLLETLRLREEALRESEARFRSLTEMSSDFYWESDAEHRLTTRTESRREAAESVFRDASPIGKRRWEAAYLSPDEAGWQAHRAMLDAHLPFRHFELSRLRANGRVHHVSVSGDPVFDAAGAFKGYRGVGADITERKQAEAALQAREERFRKLFEGASDGIMILSPEGKLIAVNGAFARMHGYSVNEMLDLNLSDLDTAEGRELAPGRMQSILSGGNDNFEVEHHHKDGHVFPLEVSASLIQSGGEPLIQAFHRDLTERRRAEAALHESDERNRILLAVSPDGIWIHNNARIAYVNDALVRMLGYDSAQEMVGRMIYEFFVPEFRAALRERVARVVSSLSHAPLAETAMLRRDASRVDVETTAAAFRQRNSIWNVSFIRDITARKRLEKLNLQAQKMEALGTLAGGVAHDFNNIIAAIMGNVELARQDVGPAHEALESLDEIRKASRRAKDLVQQILAFGRRQTLERRVIALAPVVQGAGRLLRSTLPAGIGMTVQCDPDTPAVLADATQIEQILLNLCNNAWQAMEGTKQEALIEVRLEAQEQIVGRAPDAGFELVSGDMQAGRYACLSVKDNGSGIDKETLARIFEPFFTTKPVGKGTGLGLAVVHSIAKDHGASIQVRSVPGAGSAFRIYFPEARAAEGGTQPAAPEAAIAHGQGKHILYLDDDEAIVFLMTRLLERQGYRVSGFTDARAALAAARADPGRFDLVVTDYNMPGLSGLEVARALRDIRADLPVAMASGYITDEMREQAPAAGVSELIYKPNTVEDLCEAVARLANAQRGNAASS